MTYSVSVDFGCVECQAYDKDGFSKLSEAKNYCEGLLDGKKVKWIKSKDCVEGGLGLVGFVIYKNRKND